jgi:hypothetical protein
MSTYGTGIGDRDELDPRFAPVDEVTNMAIEMARRLSTPRGALVWAPNDGIDLTLYLNRDLEPSDVNAMRTEILHEILKDERIASASVDVAFDPGGSALTLSVEGVGAPGPFSMVIAASALSISVLAINGTVATP